MTKMTTSKPSTTKTVTDSKPEATTDTNLDLILNRLNQLETETSVLKKENEVLKAGKEGTFKNAKKRYEWPRAYNYKTWGWVPVLSYVSEKKDPSRDYLYKNQYWEFTSNHLLNLSLANEKKVKVNVTEFNKSYERSEKMTAEVISDWQNTTWYRFSNEEFGQFTVKPNMIN